MDRYQSRSVQMAVNTKKSTSRTASTTTVGTSTLDRPTPIRRPKPGVRKVNSPPRSSQAGASCATYRACLGFPALAGPIAWKDDVVTHLKEVVLDLERHSAEDGWDAQ